MAGDVDPNFWNPVLRRIVSRPLLGGDRCTLCQRRIAVFYQSEVSYAWHISKPEIILHFRNSVENRYKLWAKLGKVISGVVCVDKLYLPLVVVFKAIISQSSSNGRLPHSLSTNDPRNRCTGSLYPLLLIASGVNCCLPWLFCWPYVHDSNYWVSLSLQNALVGWDFWFCTCNLWDSGALMSCFN